VNSATGFKFGLNPFARRAPLDRFAFATKLLPFTESCNGLSKWAGEVIESIGKK
jgi:hypothetical protein